MEAGGEGERGVGRRGLMNEGRRERIKLVTPNFKR